MAKITLMDGAVASDGSDGEGVGTVVNFADSPAAWDIYANPGLDVEHLSFADGVHDLAASVTTYSIIGPANVIEGNSGGATPVTYTVTRSGATNVASTVNWQVIPLGFNFVQPNDFVGWALPSGSLSFAAGETLKTLTADVWGESYVEPAEFFRVNLINPSDGTQIAYSGPTSIDNDDCLLTITAASANKPEGGPIGSTPFTFTVTRMAFTSGTVSANWAVSGTAVNGADFVGGVLPSGTVTFASGQTTSTITVNVAGDAIVETDEAFTVTLSNPSPGADLGSGFPTATGKILNDDTDKVSALSIAATAATKAEGQTGITPFTFAVTRTGGTSGNVSAHWAVGGGGANGLDFAGGSLPSGTVNFVGGQTSSTITVNVAGDTMVEANEAFTVTLSNPSTGAVLGTTMATGTILNDDARLSIAAASASKAEGQAGTTPFTFTVTRTGDTTGAASATWAVGGTAVNGADFAGGSFPSGTVTFVAGQTSSTITVNVAGDTIMEANEAFTVTLSNPSAGATLGTATATGKILNDDLGHWIGPLDARRAEGDGGTSDFTFTVGRTGSTAIASSVDWAVSGEAVNGADFVGGVLPTGTIRFAAGETLRTITVGVAGDSLVEANEAFTVTLSDPSAGTTIAKASAAGLIDNDDSAFSIRAVSTDNMEGPAGTTTPFTFSITRTGDRTTARTVGWTVDGASITGADFAGGVLPTGTVTFAAGEMVKTFSVAVAGDDIAEGDEGFRVTLSDPGPGASLAKASADAVIRNDDATSAGDRLTGTSRADYIDALAGDDKVYGLGGNDVLVGRDGNDLLDGGAGADVMVGGAGNDRYFVDQVGDIVLEVDVLHGIDTVCSTISYTLGENVEQLILIGAGAINGTGNAGDNLLSGNDAANILSGGAGDDVLEGGNGDDALNGSTGNDTASYASAAAGVAVDLAMATAQDTGGAGIDSLTAIESLRGSALDDSLKGDTGANVLSGGAGNDTIDGRAGNDVIDGGEGIDHLTGGSGADTFVFSAPLVAGQVDTIVGFDTQEDTVRLSGTVFRAFQSTFGVGDDAFELGSAATRSLTRLLYDSASGALLYDRDGNGRAAAVQFASLTGLSGELTAGNFTIG